MARTPVAGARVPEHRHAQRRGRSRRRQLAGAARARARSRAPPPSRLAGRRDRARRERAPASREGSRLRGGDLRPGRPHAARAPSTCVRRRRRSRRASARRRGGAGGVRGPARLRARGDRVPRRDARLRVPGHRGAAPGPVRDGRAGRELAPGSLRARGDHVARGRDHHVRDLRRLACGSQPSARAGGERRRSRRRAPARRGVRPRLARVVRAASRQVVLLRRGASRVHRVPGSRRVRRRLGRSDRRPASVRRARRRVPAALPRARMARWRARSRTCRAATSGASAACAPPTSATRRSCARPSSRSRVARSARCASR